MDLQKISIVKYAQLKRYKPLNRTQTFLLFFSPENVLQDPREEDVRGGNVHADEPAEPTPDFRQLHLERRPRPHQRIQRPHQSLQTFVWLLN